MAEPPPALAGVNGGVRSDGSIIDTEVVAVVAMATIRDGYQMNQKRESPRRMFKGQRKDYGFGFGSRKGCTKRTL